MLQYDGPMPYYQQIKQYIKTLIKSGQLQTDQQMPSERELCQQFKLSRTTIRLALAEAEKEGLVYRVQGKGTFVSSPKIDQGLLTMNSFEDTILSRGLRPRMTVLSAETLPGDLAINTILQLNWDAELTRLTFLGHADDDPVVHYETFMSHTIGQVVEQEAIKRAIKGDSYSTFELYRDCCGIQPIVTNQTFEAAAADDMVAEYLQIKSGAPVFLITSIVFDNTNKPVEYKKAHYRGDRFKFNISRRHL